jgi:predicted MPP superfamily phosphohydrolase
MSRYVGAWIFLFVIILLDLYVYQALKTVSSQAGSKASRWVFFIYWTISFVSIGCMLVILFSSYESWHKLLRTYLFATIIGLFLAKFLSGIFLLVDDLRRCFQYLGSFWIPALKPSGDQSGISRSVFMSWIGLITGGGLFTSLLYGFGNKYKYTVKNIPLSFKSLPKAFKGFKIVHISDIHSGSFTDIKAVQKGIDLINQQNADLILFTGDLVNYQSMEMEPYIDMFKSLKASHGVYSILGNHDYGFPNKEKSFDIKSMHLTNANAVASVHERLGWKLLRNDNVLIENEGVSIAVLGLENISAKVGFPSYGNLKKAYSGSENIPFKILMTHDPSHWESEVTSAFKEIPLTLSGHTHGMQFGVELPGFRWSPVKYVYKQWAGLYRNDQQHLYVNRGFGFIGYPGRVGILPEITVIELS